jgi:hypothetical protein
MKAEWWVVRKDDGERELKMQLRWKIASAGRYTHPG